MTTATTTTNPVTEARFAALKAKLRELFELDKSELDFGIYRIMAAKNKEVTDFLERQLKEIVRETLAGHGAGAVQQIDREIAEAREAAQAAGFNPEDSPKVQALLEKREAIGGSSSAELEADIYNHLLTFFSRYYDEGDFISKRRYKGDTYAIPYSGEEVVLHWANKDQYYIKSGEWHKDYRFRVSGARGSSAARSVRFRLIEATQEAGNNKEKDDAKRRYILDTDQPIEATKSELTLRFQFRAPTEADKQRAADGAVAIFGGDYAKPKSPKKGDERTQFCADAEKRALEALGGANGSPEWLTLVSAEASTPDKPLRTILGKHLDHFTARNTFDYFIHKDLGGFLRRELDFYIKNEVVRLDDLETLPENHLARVQGRVKAIRRVATRLIDFLGKLEDFQKKLWLKKKFVLNTNWLVTIDRVPDKLRDTVAANKDQWEEWESLGFKPGKDAGSLFGKAKWGTRAYLDACDKLVVDTRFFDEDFKTNLLASEDVLGDKESIEQVTMGTLVNGDNFHTLRVLLASLKGRVRCVYIDPPYNAPKSNIAYKNNFKHSSFLSLIESRLRESRDLPDASGSHIVAIDKNEGNGVHRLLTSTFPFYDVVAVTVEHNRKGVQDDHFSFTHEYAIFVMPDSLKELNRTERPESEWEWSNFRNWGGESLRTDAAKCFYAVLVREGKIVDFGEVWRNESQHPSGANVSRPDGTVEVYPIDGNGIERKWRYERDTVEGIQHLLRAEANGEGVIQIKIAKASDQFKTVWYSPRYNAGDNGTKLARTHMGLPLDQFDYPKSLYTVRDCIYAVTDDTSLVVDYFAGSGTTAHAVLDLNREDHGARSFVLVEMGAYFNTVLKSRTAKIIYSPDWKDGKAQSHDKGLSALVKYFAVESYEDALNNLPEPEGDLLTGADAATRDAFLAYSLDLEMGPHLLDLAAFRDPWGYSINAQLAGEDEIKRHRVDLVETFNYLLGLKVRAYGPMERYSAEFERAKHDDGLGRLKVKGRLRRDSEGAFVYQRVEGELNDGADTRVLVVWRKLSEPAGETEAARREAAEKDAAVLDAWMARHRESTKERSENRDYHLIYINGPVTLPQPTQEIRTVYPTEEVFKAKMFEDTEGDAHG
jgi:adenine-specific DNA-methyltransferase